MTADLARGLVGGVGLARSAVLLDFYGAGMRHSGRPFQGEEL
jgi:hypothetical protein